MEKGVAGTEADEECLVAMVLKLVANRIGEFPGIHGMIMRQRGLGDEEKVAAGVGDALVRLEIKIHRQRRTRQGMALDCRGAREQKGSVFCWILGVVVWV